MTGREKKMFKKLGYYWKTLNRRRSIMLYLSYFVFFLMELRKNVYKKIDLKKKSTSKLTHIHLRKHEKRDFYQDLVNNLYIIYLRFYDNKTSVSIKSLVLLCITFPQCLSLSFILCPLKHWQNVSVSIKSLVLLCITFPQCLSLSFVLCLWALCDGGS